MNFGDMTEQQIRDMHAARIQLPGAHDHTYVHGRKYTTTYNSYLFDNKPKKLSDVAISPVTHLIQGFNFILTLNNFTYGFKEISGFKIENPVEPIQEGGVNDHKLIVGVPSNETPTLECRRGLMIRCAPVFSNVSRALAASVSNNLARKAALIAVNTQDPQATLEQGPASGTIEVYDRNKRLSAMYTFMSLGMVSWECDNLNADNSDVLIESISIAHTGLTRVPLGAPNTFFGYIPNIPENQPTKTYDDKKDWLTFDLDRLEALKAQEQYLKDQEKALEKQKKDIADAKKDKEAALEKLKDEYAELQNSIAEANEAAKKSAEEKGKTAKEKAEAAEAKKQENAIDDDTAKEQAASVQAAAKEKAEAAEAKKQENAVDDDTAKGKAEQARSAAKDKAAQTEAKKHGG